MRTTSALTAQMVLSIWPVATDSVTYDYFASKIRYLTKEFFGGEEEQTLFVRQIDNFFHPGKAGGGNEYPQIFYRDGDYVRLFRGQASERQLSNWANKATIEDLVDKSERFRLYRNHFRQRRRPAPDARGSLPPLQPHQSLVEDILGTTKEN